MILVFSELVRIFNNNQYRYENNSMKESNNIIEFLQYIENNYNKCSLNSMARHFGYNSNYLGNLLKSKTGKTFSQLKLEHQLNEASILIAHTEMPIYEIAYEVGFSNLGFFYKKFKENFNINPQEYRDKYI